jgi:hypothetical protein
MWVSMSRMFTVRLLVFITEHLNQISGNKAVWLNTPAELVVIEFCD